MFITKSAVIYCHLKYHILCLHQNQDYIKMNFASFFFCKSIECIMYTYQIHISNYICYYTMKDAYVEL